MGSRIRAFDWYQSHRPWMTLNDLERQNALSCRKDAYFAAYCTNLNEDRPIHAYIGRLTVFKMAAAAILNVLPVFSFIIIAHICTEYYANAENGVRKTN